jgi:hypothetical protein
MTTPPDRRVISGAFHREKRASVTFRADPPPAPAGPVRRPAHVAQVLALAHHVQHAVEAGAAANQADVARKLGVTRACVTQLLNLALLAPDIQEAILHLEAVDGVEPMTERALRVVARSPVWTEQRRAWAGVSSALQ